MTTFPHGGARRLWSLLDMLRFYSEKFLKAYHTMNQLEIAAKDSSLKEFGPETVPFIITLFDDLETLLVDLDLQLSTKSLVDLKSHFTNHQSIASLQMAGDLARRIHDELEIRYFLALSPSEKSLFTEEKPFGEQVSSQFVSIGYEFSEAAKCLSLERSTASAFHSIRALEGAIRAISRCLNIADPTKGTDRTWGKLLEKIKTEMVRRWPNSSHTMSGDGRFFEEIHATLSAMQNPYRNSTMHLDHKYTVEEANNYLI